MVVLRAILGVVAGYVVFAAASMLLVAPVMSAEGPLVIVAALAALALIGVAAGAAAALIAGAKARIATTIVAALIALATLANLLMSLGAEPTWYKVGTLLLTAPAACLAGRRRPRAIAS